MWKDNPHVRQAMLEARDERELANADLAYLLDIRGKDMVWNSVGKYLIGRPDYLRTRIVQGVQNKWLEKFGSYERMYPPEHLLSHLHTTRLTEDFRLASAANKVSENSIQGAIVSTVVPTNTTFYSASASSSSSSSSFTNANINTTDSVVMDATTSSLVLPNNHVVPQPKKYHDVSDFLQTPKHHQTRNTYTKPSRSGRKRFVDDPAVRSVIT